MRELQKNARLSNAELAELVGMSTTACWNRTRQLETEGYIRGYVALLDQQKLGFADVVLLDNMDVPTLKEAVHLANGRVVLEASGGLTFDTIAAIAATGVDYASSGALTHSAPNFDVALDIDT